MKQNNKYKGKKISANILRTPTSHFPAKEIH